MQRHQKTALYCLDKQTEKGLAVNKETHKCICGSIHTRKSNLYRHQKTCKSYLDIQSTNKQKAQEHNKAILDPDQLLTGKEEIEPTIQSQSLVPYVCPSIQSSHLEKELKFVKSKCKLLENINYQLGDNVIYTGFIGVRDGKPYYKYGKSRQFDIRHDTHSTTYDEFKTIFVSKCEADIAELQIKRYLERKNLNDKIEVKGQNKIEIFFTTDDNPIQEILEVFGMICNLCKTQSQENERLRIENIKKDHQLQLNQEKHKMELALKDIELLKAKMGEMESKMREMELETKIRNVAINLSQ